MSSISETLARKIAASDGVYTSETGAADPQAFAVFKITNPFLGPDRFIIVYTYDQFTEYAIDYEVTEMLWCKDKNIVKSFFDDLKNEGIL